MVRVFVNELCKTFAVKGKNPVQAADRVSFEVDGKTLTLLGPSGCGKTTTMRIIAGLETADEGEVSIGDRVVCSKKLFVPPEKRRVGLVFQSFALWPHMTVFDNIAFPLKIKKRNPSEIAQRVQATLNLLRIDELVDRYPSEISGGQQQRVALARALVHEPDVLLLDEPLSNLDAHTREYARAELKRLFRSLRLSAIFVTHDQIEAMHISELIGVMNHGRLLEIATPMDLFKRPKTAFAAQFLGRINVLEGKADKTTGSIQTEIGKLYVGSLNDAENGSKVLISFRPSGVQLRNYEASKSNSFRGIIDESTFLGDYYDVSIKVNNFVLKAQIPTSVSLFDNKQVDIYIAPEDITIIRPD
jgi:iron(III) transport system ATP-binding protein